MHSLNNEVFQQERHNFSECEPFATLVERCILTGVTIETSETGGYDSPESTSVDFECDMRTDPWDLIHLRKATESSTADDIAFSKPNQNLDTIENTNPNTNSENPA